ncbi:hypothetical protein BPOR_1699g00010 [Botrytis porri]|uniref:Uncharacterized protein n=2 Tax=Botrytis porri TaxID=87229 RepID=A0A4Z1K3Y3_9HELO|nr:hypothetical protein BPOR_1699g00010 [Botrytis porri]
MHLFLLAGNQDVYNYSVLWTPTVDDIDFNVPAAGMHQLAWEHSSNNTSPNSRDFRISFCIASLLKYFVTIFSHPIIDRINFNTFHNLSSLSNFNNFSNSKNFNHPNNLNYLPTNRPTNRLSKQI